jgi:hypothetical protein
MREVEQSVDALHRITTEMSRGLSLQAEAEEISPNPVDWGWVVRRRPLIPGFSSRLGFRF